MLKKLFVLFSVLSLFVFAVPTHAEDRMTADRMEARETLKATIQERVREAKTEWASKSAELRERLQTIKDERKKTVVENVDSRISNRNEYWVKHWNSVLERLSSILDKIQARTNTASQNGKDVTSVTAAIVSAKSAISKAQDAINTQAAKTYTINVTSESTLGSSVSSTVNQFHKDVLAVVNSINEARKAVSAALKALISVVGTSPSPSASPSV